MKAVAIIPARYGSTRFPGKPLVMIGDKTNDSTRFHRLEIVLNHYLKVWNSLR